MARSNVVAHDDAAHVLYGYASAFRLRLPEDVAKDWMCTPGFLSLTLS
jgi:hypothetical protein